MKTIELQDPSGPLEKTMWLDLLNSVDEKDRSQLENMYVSLVHKSNHIKSGQEAYSFQQSNDDLGLFTKEPFAQKPDEIEQPFMENEDLGSFFEHPEDTEVDLDNLYVLLRTGGADKIHGIGVKKLGLITSLMNNQIESQATEKSPNSA